MMGPKSLPTNTLRSFSCQVSWYWNDGCIQLSSHGCHDVSVARFLDTGMMDGTATDLTASADSFSCQVSWYWNDGPLPFIIAVRTDVSVARFLDTGMMAMLPFLYPIISEFQLPGFLILEWWSNDTGNIIEPLGFSCQVSWYWNDGYCSKSRHRLENVSVARFLDTGMMVVWAVLIS